MRSADKKIIAGIAALVLLHSGCARKSVPIVHVPSAALPAEEKIDPETRQRVEHILQRVRRISETAALETLGRTTMNEAVAIMDMGDKTVQILVKALKQPSNWKFRFWIVDMLGYVGGAENIIPLVEVIEDSTENMQVRIRACESLRELKLSAAVSSLLIAREIVSDAVIRIEIQKTIDYLR